MPHAESSVFPTDRSKEEIFELLLENAKALLDRKRNWGNQYSNLANIASLLWHAYDALSAEVNWSGFYVREDMFPRGHQHHHQQEQQVSKLLLGLFQGKTACQEIRLGSGVCGTAAQRKDTVLVPNVHAFPGHIACDNKSRSEIAVPILVDEKVVAIIDIDCARTSGFDEVDQKYLETLAALLAERCNW